MAARVTLIHRETGIRRPMFSVDARQLMEGERRAVRRGDYDKPYWEVDRKAQTGRAKSDDQKIQEEIWEGAGTKATYNAVSKLWTASVEAALHAGNAEALPALRNADKPSDAADSLRIADDKGAPRGREYNPSFRSFDFPGAERVAQAVSDFPKLKDHLSDFFVRNPHYDKRQRES